MDGGDSMSMYKEQMFKCCNCRNEEKIKIWKSINVTIDKKEKERILNSTFLNISAVNVERNPKLKIAEAHLNYYNNKYMIVFFLEDGRVMESVMNKEFYNGLKMEYSRVLNKNYSKGFQQVDFNWAESFLESN